MRVRAGIGSGEAIFWLNGPLGAGSVGVRESTGMEAAEREVLWGLG